MNPAVFREYDIRGVAEADFPDTFVADLGRATGSELRARGARRVTLGRDCRLSSPRIHATFKRELLAVGLDVVDVGVMITASHNPGPDNGFKIVIGRSTIYGADIQKLRERIERRDFQTAPTPGRT